MAIKHRQGDEIDLDISQLVAGEMAVCTDTGKIVVKLAGENYLVLADSESVKIVQDALADKAPLKHTHSMADISDMISSGIILYDNADGDNTSETLELSDSSNNYSAIEVIYGTPSTRHSVRCAVGDANPTIMSIIGGDETSISIYSSAFLIQDNALLRDTALSDALDKIAPSEQRFAINYPAEGELAVINTVRNSEDGYYISIYRVIAYK